VLTGRNIRNSTENLTRRRIAILNIAILKLFIEGSHKADHFVDDLPKLAVQTLKQRGTSVEKLLAAWVLGLTGKGIQNVLRSDHRLIQEYQHAYVDTCNQVVARYRQEYGELTGFLELGTGVKANLDWLFMVYLLNTIGSQTLTIRGSEKSLYGKFFEKLILGSLLQILGFEHVPSGDSERLNRVFWLSSNIERERESDATLLYEPGKGIRFDIGFIGSGNTEISLDKVSRYRREVEMGSTHWFMGTIILVDRIGERSNIEHLAQEIGGTIIQMSAGYWPQKVARTLNRILGFEHVLIEMEQDDIEDYLKQKLQEVSLASFLPNT
jgi:hypothetical protein